MEIKNTIIKGDASELILTIPDQSVDLILTDPPYNFKSSNLKGGGFYVKENKLHFDTIENKWGLKFEPLFYLTIMQNSQEIKSIKAGEIKW